MSGDQLHTDRIPLVEGDYVNIYEREAAITAIRRLSNGEVEWYFSFTEGNENQSVSGFSREEPKRWPHYFVHAGNVMSHAFAGVLLCDVCGLTHFAGEHKDVESDTALPAPEEILVEQNLVPVIPESANLGLATTEELMRELICRFKLDVFGRSADLISLGRALVLAEMLGGLDSYTRSYRTVD